MAKYDKVGGGNYGVYKKRDNPWPAIITVGIVIFLIIAANGG
ncbi:MAG: hypothetical protein AAFW68_13990 [Pseudomonadota bacterium]